MSKKNAILITLLAAIITIVGLVSWYLFLSPQKNTGTETNGGGIKDLILNFFPQGKPPTDGGKVSTSTDGKTDEKPLAEENVSGVPLPTPRVYRVSLAPVSSFSISETKASSSVRYMESETGHIYTASLSSIIKDRLSNTTIPKLREAIWLSSSNRLVARYLDENGADIKSFTGSITPKKSTDGNTPEGSFEGSFLKDNALELIAAPTQDRLFYFEKDDEGISGIVANSTGGNATKIFSSPIREWLPQWIKEGTLYISTKPSGSTQGYLFSVNTQSGVQTRILGKIFGLTSNVNPTNTAILYSESSQRGFSLFLYDLKTKIPSSLPLITLPEKCAWDPTNKDVIFCGVPKTIPAGLYPDTWYKGVTSFSDELWQLNLKTGEALVAAIFEGDGISSVDITRPQVSSDGKYLVFINKDDLTLWSVTVR